MSVPAEPGANESLCHAMVEAASTAMVLVDREGRIALVNAQAEHLFGASRSKLIGQPAEALLPERCRANHPSSRAGFFATPKAHAMCGGRDLYARTLDGSEFPVEIGLSPIETAEGTMALASIVDITQRKRAEQALRESEEGFRLLVDGVKDYAIFMLDTDGRVINWHKEADAIKGYRAEEVLGQPFSIFFTEDDKRACSPEEHLPVALDLGSYEDEVIRVRKGGKQFWANVVLTASGKFCPRASDGCGPWRSSTNCCTRAMTFRTSTWAIIWRAWGSLLRMGLRQKPGSIVIWVFKV